MSSVEQPTSSTKDHVPFMARLRLRQIRLVAAVLTLLGREAAARRFLICCRSWPVLRRCAEACLGFRRTFPSFADAQACASRYIRAGHEHPDEIIFHRSSSGKLRESDYPVLFHLAPVAGTLRRVLDLGGSVGNLFYSYQPRVPFPSDVAWQIFDIPAVRTLGEKLAASRSETRLRYVDSLACGKGCDLFLASGSLHYFEEPLDVLLETMGSSPAHVIVNRTPCSDGEDLITVQDNGTFLVPCKLHSRSKIIAGMNRLGYELVAEWPVFERALVVPLHPEVSARQYSGFYFRR